MYILKNITDHIIFRFLSRITDFFLLNILWIIFSIPLFTMGASTAALYSVMFKLIQKNESYIAREFFYAFKNNFKQGTALWFGSLFLQLILTADFLIIWQMDLAFLGNILFAFLFIIEFFVISMSLYAYALIARYTLSLSAVIKNSFLLSFGRLPYSMLMILICLLPVILTCLNLYTLLAGILFYFTIGISLLCWLLSHISLYIFKFF